MSGLITTEILSQLKNEKKVNISFHYHTEAFLKSIDSIFSRLLARLDLIYLLDPTVTILREIIANAVKANAKRYYFQKINLNINNLQNYEEGIKKFKFELTGSDTIGKELKNTDYKVILSIIEDNNQLKIKVENNSAIHPEELKRINHRINKAKTFKDFTDAYDEIYDDTEGAGLGIVLTILLLKNTGMGENGFSIKTNGKITQTRFRIPYDLKPKTLTSKIKEQIINEIDGLPSFNQNILELQKLCKDPNASINNIVDKISLDPALTAEILKLSNSAGFITVKKIEQISEAIMTIGLSNLHDLLLITGTRRILEKRYPKFQEIWNHCNKAANYASHIANNFSKSKNNEFAFLGGLLHDLGKLVLLSTDSKFTSWISDITKDRKVRSSTILEELSIGISHSTIGELMAKKWNFPEYLIEAIKYHHSPLSAKEKYKEFIFPVYLANMLCGFESGKYHYFYLEEDVLEKLNLSSNEKIDDLHSELKKKFSN